MNQKGIRRLVFCAAAITIAGAANARAQSPDATSAVKSVSATTASSSSTGDSSAMPRVFAPTQPRVTYTRYPWKKNIVTTVFWIGEQPTQNNPVPNTKSSWDVNWQMNYGGYDDPDESSRDWDFTPKTFTPGLNPFYVALPYNDVVNWRSTKSEAKTVIPWFHQRFNRPGQSVCKGQWIAIRKGSKVCYAQWEDCGPFETTDHSYVFGDAKPKTGKNGGAGLDVSPAVRDYLGMKSGDRVDWRFVELQEIPTGPWARYGSNNDFVKASAAAKVALRERLSRLREQRDSWLDEQKYP